MPSLYKFGNKVVQPAVNVMVSVAATALAVMMFLMAADVIFRYLFNSPIPGALELIEFLMAIIVPFSIAYCAKLKAHVTVDLVVERFPAKVRSILRFIITSISCVFVTLICWQNFAYIFETYQSNLTSAVLKIPAAPFVAAAAIGTAVFAIILFIELFQSKSKE
ncbi:TRAP-type C4-dicarboxylate transport system, small permease component [Desulfopila aestuarii DSM 18488]|uniref:TRAP-type C4-dicarboxylate transport system, small permease component n=2 Tax=Desulfopila aestuarii TaxID=231440 RepID=A0A1M7XXZ2_9BACT|nr:TRAP-type C4-dicarboxylate transport system, small permease component [Desulfopila aestuarii DSM 18488]